MLLHLPIVILATLSPIHVSDTVPTFDIVKECRYESGSTANVERCSQDERWHWGSSGRNGRSLAVPTSGPAWR